MRLFGIKILDNRLIQYLLLFYLVSFVLSTGSAMLSKLAGADNLTYGWMDMFFGYLVRYVAKFLFIFGAILLIRFLFLKKIIKSWMRWFLHAIFGIGLTFYSVISQLILNYWLYGFEINFDYKFIYVNALKGTDYNFFLYFSSVAIVYAYYFFQKQKDLQLKESNLKTQLLDAKINALQSQLQPHFLFNALNDISSLIDVSTIRSQDAIADLSEMLRLTLNIKDTKLIPLSQELMILQKYLDIEKMRFDEKLNYTIDVLPELEHRKVPPLVLQPIVENSIKHGFSYQHDLLTINIMIRTTGKFLHIIVNNNGPKLEMDKLVFGTGISNVISRLDTLYDGNFVFEIDNLKSYEKGVQTTINIPLN